VSTPADSSTIRHASTAFSPGSVQNFHDAGQNRESGKARWWGRRGSSASVEYATAAGGGHVADGGTHGGGATHG
jgi:hypothetical protein